MMHKIKDFFKENIMFFFFIIVLLVITRVNLPYAIYTPGGSINLSERISGENTYQEEGSLSMTYVSMAKGTPLFMLLSFIIPNWDYVPTESISYEGETFEETFIIDRIYLNEAYSNAEFVAYENAGINYSVTKTKNVVTLVDSDALTNLKSGDEILSIDGNKYSSLEEFQKYIESKQVGDKVSIDYIRDDKKYTDECTLIDLKGKPRVGIGIATISEYKTPFNINIETKYGETGPSGGFLTALEIYNKITPKDITKGKKIMGTGTIDKDGNVGEIGGVKYKILGASRDGADVFICPKENEKEALKTVKDNHLKVEVIGVKNFKEALKILEDL